MNLTKQPSTAKRFDVFISYSHAADDRLAPAIQHGLHRLAKPWYKLRALCAFRDETDLSATPEFWTTIQNAAANSEYFVLLASPEAAASKWVKREVSEWLTLGRKDKLLIVLTGGKIVWRDGSDTGSRSDFAWPETSALPEEVLRGVFQAEPKWVGLSWARGEHDFSLRNPHFLQTIAQIAAPIRKLTVDELVSADYREHRKTMRLLGTGITVIVLFAMFSFVTLFRAYREAAGAADALALLENAMFQVDPISADSSPPTLERFLDQVTKELDRRTNLHPDAAARIHTLLGSLYFRLDPRSDGTGVADAARHYGRAVELRTKAYGATHPLTLESKNNLAVAMNKGGSPADATELLGEILPDRARSDDAGASLRTRGNRAAALLRQGRHDEAKLEFDAVFEGFVKNGDYYEALKARMWQARLLMEAGHHTDAEELQREALRRSETEGPLYNDLTLAIMDQLTYNLVSQKKWASAKTELLRMQEFLNQQSGPEHKLQFSVRYRLGIVLRNLGDVIGLEAVQKEMYEWEKKYGK